MDRLKHWLTIEKEHFNKLTTEGQRLLSTSFLYNLISPIFSLFINAFLWRQSENIILVALYNLSLFVAIPFGFFLNGLLLRKFSSSMLYCLGLLLVGATIATLIFLPQITLMEVIIFGLVDGIASGIFWSNRNLLTLRTTQSENRIYFSSMESSFKTLTTILVPVFIGYFIIFGSTINLYTPIQGYEMLAIMMLIIIGIVWKVMSHITVKQPIPHFFLKKPGKSWQRFRLYELCFGILNGSIVFLPVLIVLSLGGQEATLGTIQSFAAILTAILVYIMGKRLGVKHRMPILIASVVVIIVGSLVLSITYSAIGVLVFFACKALNDPLTWISLNSLNYDIIDKENKDEQNHYAYVCDQEIYLNVGRIIGVLFFLSLIHMTSNEFALRFAPLFFALSQLFLIFIAISAEKHHKKIN